MLKKLLKQYKEPKVTFCKGEKVLYLRTNEIVEITEHSSANIILIKISTKSLAYKQDFAYVGMWEKMLPSADGQNYVEVTVAIQEILKLPNPAIANLLYD